MSAQPLHEPAPREPQVIQVRYGRGLPDPYRLIPDPPQGEGSEPIRLPGLWSVQVDGGQIHVTYTATMTSTQVEALAAAMMMAADRAEGIEIIRPFIQGSAIKRVTIGQVPSAGAQWAGGGTVLGPEEARKWAEEILARCGATIAPDTELAVGLYLAEDGPGWHRDPDAAGLSGRQVREIELRVAAEASKYPRTSPWPCVRWSDGGGDAVVEAAGVAPPDSVASREFSSLSVPFEAFDGLTAEQVDSLREYALVQLRTEPRQAPPPWCTGELDEEGDYPAPEVPIPDGRWSGDDLFVSAIWYPWDPDEAEVSIGVRSWLHGETTWRNMVPSRARLLIAELTRQLDMIEGKEAGR